MDYDFAENRAVDEEISRECGDAIYGAFSEFEVVADLRGIEPDLVYTPKQKIDDEIY